MPKTIWTDPNRPASPGSIKKTRENFIAKRFYRPLSEPIAIFVSRFGVTPNQVTLISIIFALLSGVFFISGEWKYSALGALFLQLGILSDHVDGSLARYTGNLTAFGQWWDAMANKLIKFFPLLGMSFGAYQQTGQPLMLVLGSVAIFNFTYSAFISQLKKEVPGAKDRTIMPETSTSFFPASMIIYWIITLGGLTNQLWFPLAFLSTFGFIWIKQILNVYNASK